MFRAPEAPAPMANIKTEVKARTGFMLPGAINSPIAPVKITRLITRGLSSAIKSLAAASWCEPRG